MSSDWLMPNSFYCKYRHNAVREQPEHNFSDQSSSKTVELQALRIFSLANSSPFNIS